MDAILTFDIGGTFIRGALFNLAGQLLHLESLPADEVYLDPEGNQADPKLWWRAVCRLTDSIMASISGWGVCLKAIAPCGMTRTQVFLDARGKPLRPAITFRDARAQEQAGELRQAFEQTGQGEEPKGYSPASPYHPLARLLWVKQHEPDIMQKTRWVLQPKDYVIFRLCGVPTADSISAASFSIHGGEAPGRELFQALGLDYSMLPKITEPQAMAGRVLADLEAPFDRFKGVPVFTGSMDAWCGTLGIGAVRPGYGYNITGTTEAMGLVCDKPAMAPGLVSLPWGGEMHQIGGPTQAGGDCLAWLMQNAMPGSSHGQGEYEDMGNMLSLDRRPAPIFLPYLDGERTPLWNPQARGVFFGLKRVHTREDMLRAVMQGVAFANRHILELAEQAAGITAREIRISGGAAKLNAWCQIKADVLARPLVRTSQEETGLFGAALLAMCGLGMYPDFGEVQKSLVYEKQRFLPDPDMTEYYDRAYRLYLRLIDRLTPCFADYGALENMPGGLGND
jgi:xylulokinase